jgi:hypothetical protein
MISSGNIRKPARLVLASQQGRLLIISLKLPGIWVTALDLSAGD